MNEDLHVAYRPETLEDVVGHSAVVESLEGFEEHGWPHTFLFSGPSGVGKTTFARIIANILEAEVVEVDAARYSGVENIRQLTQSLNYKPIDPKHPNRLFIIDECHSLSKQAWQSLLKATEEPPEFIYFVLCTTEYGKVPKTIKTRSHFYDLKPVSVDEVAGLVDRVSEEEGITIHPHDSEAIAEASEGSPRQALVYLSQVRSVGTKDIKAILALPGTSPEVIDFCRALIKPNFRWSSAMKYVKSFEKQYPAESVRIIVVNYFSKVAINSTSMPESALSVLDAFSGEWPQTDKYAPMLLALGELFSD